MERKPTYKEILRGVCRGALGFSLMFVLFMLILLKF
jgi:hypothetical protein